MHGKSLSRPDNWSGEVSQAGEGKRPALYLILGYDYSLSNTRGDVSKKVWLVTNPDTYPKIKEEVIRGYYTMIY